MLSKYVKHEHDYNDRAMPKLCDSITLITGVSMTGLSLLIIEAGDLNKRAVGDIRIQSLEIASATTILLRSLNYYY
jgi:tRNA G18 (ribose-2'-O)-methylase SpoU